MRNLLRITLICCFLASVTKLTAQNTVSGSVGAWDGKEAAMEITAAEVNIDFILDERARELVGEGHRWFDLVRTNKLIDRVKAHNLDAMNNIQSYHVLRPIPLDQIDRTEGGYSQNPGYTQ